VSLMKTGCRMLECWYLTGRHMSKTALTTKMQIMDVSFCGQYCRATEWESAEYRKDGFGWSGVLLNIKRMDLQIV